MRRRRSFRLRQRDAQSLAARNQELVGKLDQETGTVARIIFTSTCTAMTHVDQRGDAVADDLVRFLPFQVDDEPHGAAIVFVVRVVQTLGCRVDLGAYLEILSTGHEARGEVGGRRGEAPA